MTDPGATKDTGSKTPTKSETPADATAAADWKSVIGIEPLKSEVKSIRNSLNAHLQNVGKFNSGLAAGSKWRAAARK